MMSYAIRMKSLVSGLVLLSALAPAQRFDPNQWVVVGESAYGLVSPSVVVADSLVSYCGWVGSGKKVIVLRAPGASFPSEMEAAAQKSGKLPEPFRFELSVWDRKSRSKQSTLNLGSWHSASGEVHNLGDSGFALAEVMLYRADGVGGVSKVLLFEVSESSGTARLLWDSPESKAGTGPRIRVVTKGPQALIALSRLSQPTTDLSSLSATENSAHVYDPRSGLGPAIPLPSGMADAAWSVAPNKLVVWTTEFSQGKASQAWYELDATTGRVSPLPGPRGNVFYERERLDGPLRVALGGNAAGLPNTAMLVPQVAPGEEVRGQAPAPPRNPKVPAQYGNAALIEFDASSASLSPTGEEVLVVSRGVALIRPITPAPIDEFIEKLEQQLRNEVLMKAKMAGVALIMYATDNDERFPSKTDNVEDLLSPYVKNREVLKGFVYTFGGGNMASIQNPADTEMGYVVGPGGRAVVFADGHAKWVSDK
ncbi:MAG: hypothetical protein UZ18_ATM001001014 [Armatimonadetes bacterium OLB18]|nr:MAG: hypothetical protein UZ18_ATM001001014 [Armatimonadetes bacterium OLB18]